MNVSEYSKLKKQIVGCELCKLYKSCDQPVISNRKTKADIAIIIDSPSKDDDNYGAINEKLFEKIKREYVGELADRAAIIPLVNCWPNLNGENILPTKTSIKACKKNFKKQLEFYSPKLLILCSNLSKKIFICDRTYLKFFKSGEYFCIDAPSLKEYRAETNLEDLILLNKKVKILMEMIL